MAAGTFTLWAPSHAGALNVTAPADCNCYNTHGPIVYYNILLGTVLRMTLAFAAGNTDEMFTRDQAGWLLLPSGCSSGPASMHPTNMMHNNDT